VHLLPLSLEYITYMAGQSITTESFLETLSSCTSLLLLCNDKVARVGFSSLIRSSQKQVATNATPAGLTGPI
jgi:hypothetical protein